MKFSIVILFIAGCSYIRAAPYQSQQELDRRNAKEIVDDSFKVYTGGAVGLADHFVTAADRRKQTQELHRLTSPGNEDQWKRKEELQGWKDTMTGLKHIFGYVGDTVGTAVKTANVQEQRQRNFDSVNQNWDY